MGMTVAEFEEMRVGDFFLKLRYFMAAKEEKIILDSNLIRLQTVELLNIQVDSRSRIKDPRDLWRFPWEDEDENEGMLPDLESTDVRQNLKNLYKVWERD
jgi:hypothetical protein